MIKDIAQNKQFPSPRIRLKQNVSGSVRITSGPTDSFQMVEQIVNLTNYKLVAAIPRLLESIFSLSIQFAIPKDIQQKLYHPSLHCVLQLMMQM